eukprot:jgi/Mesvir1/2783/Mv05123-RA.1
MVSSLGNTLWPGSAPATITASQSTDPASAALEAVTPATNQGRNWKQFFGTTALAPAVAYAAQYLAPLLSRGVTSGGAMLGSALTSGGRMLSSLASGAANTVVDAGSDLFNVVANYDTVYGSVGATVKPELNTAGVSPDVNKIRQIIRSNFIAGRVGNEMSQVIAETGNQQWVNHVIENAFYSDKITNLTTTVTPPSGLTDGTLTIQFEIADYNLLVGGVRVFKLLDSMISKADKFTFNRTVITANDRAADNATIFYYGNGTEGFGLFHTNGGLLKLKVTSGSADNIMSVTGAVVGDGKWHNLILTRVAAAANSARWKLWVDGVEHSSSASPRRRSN